MNAIGESRARSRLAGAVALLALAVAPASAATFAVNSTADEPDAMSGDGICATATSACTLRAAIQQADALGGVNTITVPAGTYALTLGVLATTNQTNMLTIDGTGAAGTVIIDGGALSGVFTFSGGSVTVNNLTMQNGSRGTNNPGSFGVCTGGAIFVSNATTVSVTASVIAGNQAPNASGGGICVGNGGTLSLADTTVRDNTGTFGGGGMRVLTDGTATITRSSFTRNHVPGFGGGGGGIENQGTLTLTNSTLSGNTLGAGTGGGVAIESGQARLTSVTIVGNSGEGQLAAFQGTTIVESTIVARAAAGPNCTIGASATFTSNGHNLESTNVCHFTAAGDQVDTDPLLGPLAMNGGLTRTHALLPGSTAIDAGDPATCPATDQRGVARPQDGDDVAGAVCDIGAYEVRGGAPRLLAAVLPASRSVQIGTPASAFATIINQGPGTATGCEIFPVPDLPGSFGYQTTDPATNLVTGSPNTPADIGAGATQSFVLAVTPSVPIAPTDVPFTFVCANADPAPIVTGLNTLLLSASATPVPDIVALAVTASGDGIVNLFPTLGPMGVFVGAFAVATVNVGNAGGPITASADTGGVALPLGLSVCQTDTTTGECLAAPGPTATAQIDPGATPTFAFFATSTQPIPLEPAGKRIFVRMKDANGMTRGSTSVAVQTQ